MAIEQAIVNGKNTWRYRELDKQDLYNQMKCIVDLLKIYVSGVKEISFGDIACDFPRLADLIIRIDKRKDYFMIFHDTVELNELRRSALISYWLLKFRPFYYKNSVRLGKEIRSNINVALSLFVMLSAISGVSCRRGKQFKPSTEYLKKLAYAFRYWDLSKEAIMMISESLCEAACN